MVDDISGSVIVVVVEIDDLGIYNVEQVDIVDLCFICIGGLLLDLYCGGIDESIFGFFLCVQGNQLQVVGVVDDISLCLYGVQQVILVDNQFVYSGCVCFSYCVGEFCLCVCNNVFIVMVVMQFDIFVEILL